MRCKHGMLEKQCSLCAGMESKAEQPVTNWASRIDWRMRVDVFMNMERNKWIPGKHALGEVRKD